MKNEKMIKEIESYLYEVCSVPEPMAYLPEYVEDLITSKQYDEDFLITFNEWITVKWICNKYKVSI